MRLRKKTHLHHPTLPSPVALRLERWHRYSLYGIFLWLTASGVAWLVAHYFMRIHGEFGDTPHPLEAWSMKLHGLGVMASLFFVGSLLNLHIRRALKMRRNLVTGWAMIAGLAFLVLTGYGLYYLASEDSRPAWSLIHWIVGLALPPLVVTHIAVGRKSMARGNAAPRPPT